MAAAQNTTYQALYRACMKEAAGQGSDLMQRTVRRAADALLDRSRLAPDSAQAKALADAARVLVKHEVALCEAFSHALLAEFTQAISGPARPGPTGPGGLSLVGTDEVDRGVEQWRVQQLVRHGVAAELTELNGLVCAAQGLATVQADRNPLRPDVYVRSLHTVVQQSPVPSELRSHWMLHLGESLAAELAPAYRQLSDFLRKQGVREAGYTVADPAGAAGKPDDFSDTLPATGPGPLHPAPGGAAALPTDFLDTEPAPPPGNPPAR